MKVFGFSFVWILLAGSLLAPLGLGLSFAVVATSTILSSSQNPSTFGQTVTLTAIVSSGATGVVQFNDTATNPPTILGTISISGTVATFSTSLLSIGTHDIVASYLGDANNAPSTSSVLVQIVNHAPLVATGINISSDEGSSFQGPVARFTDADPNAVSSDYTGTINWGDGTTSSAVIVANSNGGFDVSGTHSYATAGTKTLSITINDSGGSSATVTETITTNKMSSTTTVASSQNPSTSGHQVTFTATVSPGTATGTIQFLSNGTSLGAPVVLSGGQATLVTSSLSTGNNNITASYSGDSVFGSSRGTIFQAVNKIATTTALASSNNPSASGQSVTFTAMVSPSSATGTVTFMDGTTILDTGTISSGASTFTISTLSAGVHDLVAIYIGDANHIGSSSAVLAQTVNQATGTSTVTSLSSNATSIDLGHAITFTVTVSPNTATGAVNLLVNSTNLASSTLSNGQVTFTTSLLPAGFDNIVASYLGNNQFNPSTSNSVGVTVITQGSGGGQTINGTLSSATNLGQLVSDFVHARNDLKKDLRQQTVDIIHACRAEAKSASHGDRKQLEQECKLQLQQVKQNFKNLQNQLKQEFVQLRTQFQSDIKQLHQQENTDEKNMTENFNNQISSLQGEIKQLHKQEGLERKNMTQNFNTQISFLQGDLNNNGNDHKEQKMHGNDNGAKNVHHAHKGKGNNKQD